MPDFDFTGLSEAAQAAFKPQFSEVVRREARRRRTARLTGATLTVAAIAVGVTTVGLPGTDRSQIGGPGFDPRRTPDFDPRPAGTPDPDRSGSKTGPMVVGDLGHLYVRWHDCRSASDCALMVAATADGGATWRSYPLPVGRNAMVDLRAVGPRTLVAWAQSDLTGGEQPVHTWHASTDGGATWRDVQPSTVDAIPAGWRVLDDFEYLGDGLTAVDPVTGAVAAVPLPPLEMGKPVAGLPPAAGLWVSGYTGTTSTPATDASGQALGEQITGTGSAVEVSRDGGRSWYRHVFAEELIASTEGSSRRGRDRHQRRPDRLRGRPGCRDAADLPEPGRCADLAAHHRRAGGGHRADRGRVEPGRSPGDPGRPGRRPAGAAVRERRRRRDPPVDPGRTGRVRDPGAGRVRPGRLARVERGLDLRGRSPVELRRAAKGALTRHRSPGAPPGGPVPDGPIRSIGDGSKRARMRFSAGLLRTRSSPTYRGLYVAQDVTPEPLDPHRSQQGDDRPGRYWHVDDIKATLNDLLDAGAQALQEVKDVGGGKLIASVKNADGNVIGLIQPA